MVAPTNGRLDVNDLSTVSGVLLNRVTAAAFTNMDAACRAAVGSGLDIVNDGGGYRSFAYQQWMYDRRAAYLPIIIARPGLSTHGWGTALDLTTTCFTPRVRVWLGDNAATFGFARPPVNDPRHFLHNGRTTGPTPTPTPKPEPLTAEDDMPRYIYTTESGTGYALIDSNYVDGVIITADPNIAAQFSWITQASGGSGVRLSRAAFNSECSAAVALWRAHASKAELVWDPADTDALAAAIAAKIPGATTADIVEALRPDFAAVQANIDDQPTTFTVTPS